MPKSELISSVEKISERIARKVLKDCKFFGTMGTWVKTLQDENRTLKRRVEELEIRVKKLNDYGPTPIVPAKRHAASGDAQKTPETAMKTPSRLTKAQVKKIRTARGLSQAQFAQLLGVSYFRYNKWELGKTAIPPDSEQRIMEIKGMKASDLRTCMQNVGIFQPNGKLQAATKKLDVETMPESLDGNNATGKTDVPVGLSAAASPKTVPRTPRRKTAGSNAISAEEVKFIRSALNMTQYEIATKLKIKENRYKNWEQGRVKMPVAFIKKIRALSTAKTQEEAMEPTTPASRIPQAAATSAAISANGLQALRGELGLTRREMADALNIKKSRYCNWEYGLANAAPQFVEKMRQMLKEEKGKVSSAVSEKQPSADADAQRECPQSDFSDILNPDNVPAALSPIQLKEIRAFLKLTQLQFAKLLNIKGSRFTNWECGYGKASPDYVRQILGLLAQNIRAGNDAPNGKADVIAVEPEADGEAVLSAEEIRRIRTELGMSRRQAAEALAIKESRYKNWECGMANVPARFSRMILTLRTSERRKEESAHRPPAVEKAAVEPRQRPSVATAEEMKKIRAAFGVSKRQMAELISVHENSYGCWERGTRAIPAAWSDKIKSLRGLTSAQRKAMLREAGIELPAPKRTKVPRRKNEDAK